MTACKAPENRCEQDTNEERTAGRNNPKVRQGSDDFPRACYAGIFDAMPVWPTFRWLPHGTSLFASNQFMRTLDPVCIRQP